MCDTFHTNIPEQILFLPGIIKQNKIFQAPNMHKAGLTSCLILETQFMTLAIAATYKMYSNITICLLFYDQMAGIQHTHSHLLSVYLFAPLSHTHHTHTLTHM